MTECAATKREMNMNYAIAKAASTRIDNEVTRLGRILQAYPRNAMGLVSDAVRLSPEYRADKSAYDKAFSEMRSFNAWYVKAFKAEIRADRNKRFAA